MNFDMETTLQDMLAAMEPILEDEWDNLKEYCEAKLRDNGEILQELAALRSQGELTDEEVKKEIRRETKVLEAQMQARMVHLKASAQKAMNAASEVFITAVKAAM